MFLWPSILAALFAGALGLWATLTKVRYDSVDFQGRDLKLQGQRAALATVVAALSILLQAADRLTS